MASNHNFTVGQFTKLATTMREASGGGSSDRVNSFGRAKAKEPGRFDTPFDTKYDDVVDDDTAFFGKPKMLQFSADSDEELDMAIDVNLVEMVHKNDIPTSPFSLKRRDASRSKSKRPNPKSVTFDEKVREEFGLNCHSPNTPVSSIMSPGMKSADRSPALRPHVSPLINPTRTPNSNNNSCHTCDSGIFTPTPKSSPVLVMTTPTSSSSKRIHTGSMTSPVPLITYDFDSDEPSVATSSNEASMPSATTTPPHGRLSSLRLLGKPLTPKLLLERSQRRTFREPLHPRQLTSEICESNVELVKGFNTPKVCLTAPKSCLRAMDINCIRTGRKLDPNGPQANVNPFLHNSNLRSGSKRGRRDIERSEYPGCSPMEQGDGTPELPRKKLAMRDMNTSRYREEFHEISKIGSGEFGSVFDCVNRLDGCHYAIKKSKSPVAGSINERGALNEVYAHAVLEKHIHVVRYFSAWAEKGHMFIQNEFCNGGSLAGAIDDFRRSGRRFTESELVYILVQTARGLCYIHSEGLVHLDIKPANILIHREQVRSSIPVPEIPIPEIPDEVLYYEADLDPTSLRRIYYKIADLGHVTSLSDPHVEEGDCRYLPVEVLQETYKDLTKADVFSLALTIYEAATLTDLPKNGPAWHSIRECGVPHVPHLSSDFNSLLNIMSSYDPAARPSCKFLAQHSALVPSDLKARRQLAKELNLQKLQNETLAREIAEAREILNEQTLAKTRKASYSSPSTRLVGRSYPRSISLTNF